MILELIVGLIERRKYNIWGMPEDDTRFDLIKDKYCPWKIDPDKDRIRTFFTERGAEKALHEYARDVPRKQISDNLVEFHITRLDKDEYGCERSWDREIWLRL